MDATSDLSDRFLQAVTAIDAGDLAALETILSSHPHLATGRLEGSPQWLRAQAGDALDGFFARPYLLWFVAEDPARRGTLPDNIVEIARAIIGAARSAGPATLQEQLDYTLRLVCWSEVAAARGAQIPLIDLLVDEGASPAAEVNNALVNGHTRAAEHLLDRGGQLTFAAAVCLGRWADMDRMAPDATPEQRRFAFVLAALNGRAESLRRMLALGVDVNRPSEVLYSHGTPLHHAVCSGSLDAVKVLVESGADLDRPDTAWNGTPLGWARHYVETAAPDRKAGYARIAAWLQGAVH